MHHKQQQQLRAEIGSTHQGEGMGTTQNESTCNAYTKRHLDMNAMYLDK